MTNYLVILFAASITTFTGCATPDSGDDGSGQGCETDHCVCTGTDSCARDCTTGAAECHVQSATGPVNVQCDHNGECHVECAVASSCAVACGDSAECHVTCPAAGCTVSECVGEACEVTCGLGGIATRNGTTATCP